MHCHTTPRASSLMSSCASCEGAVGCEDVEVSNEMRKRMSGSSEFGNRVVLTASHFSILPAVDNVSKY